MENDYFKQIENAAIMVQKTIPLCEDIPKNNNSIRVIDVVEAYKLGFNLGNSVNYILRAGTKNSILHDLLKAQWHLQREINNLKGEMYGSKDR